MGLAIALGIACVGLAITSFGLGYAVCIWVSARKRKT
jgi:hypothetical protein